MANEKLIDIIEELAVISNVLMEIAEDLVDGSDDEPEDLNLYDGPGYPRITMVGEQVRRIDFNENDFVLVEERRLTSQKGVGRPEFYPGVKFIPGEEERGTVDRYDFYFVPGYATMRLAERIDTDHPDAVGIIAEHEIADIRNRVSHWTVQ